MVNQKYSAELTIDVGALRAGYSRTYSEPVEVPQWVNDGTTYGGFIVGFSDLYATSNASSSPPLKIYKIPATRLTSNGQSVGASTDMTSSWTSAFGTVAQSAYYKIASSPNMRWSYVSLVDGGTVKIYQVTFNTGSSIGSPTLFASYSTGSNGSPA